MSLIQSARLNGHDPYAYLKDVITRLPTQKNHQIADLLPHRWRPAAYAEPSRTCSAGGYETHDCPGEVRMAEKSDQLTGTCALCGPDNNYETKILRKSHFLPKHVYKHLNDAKAEDTKLLLRTQEKNKVFSMGTQIVQPMLCDTCETLMSKHGEDYIAKVMLKTDVINEQQSPIYMDLLNGLFPSWKPQGLNFDRQLIFSVGAKLLPGIDAERIYHFAIGMFWKATFDGWRHCRAMPLEPSLIEKMRGFLRGGEYVTDYIVRIVPSFWKPRHGVTFPALLQGNPFFSIQQFDFYFEKMERSFRRAISTGNVPLLYTLDSQRSVNTFLALSETYSKAELTKSAEDTQLSWLGDGP